MGGFDVIITSDFYQAPLVQDSQFFSSKKLDLIF
jgi:hypothetical protein